MLSVAFMWLIILSLALQGEQVPRYRLGLLVPSYAERDEINQAYNTYVTRYNIWRTYLEAIRDINAYFGDNFTLYGSFSDSNGEDQVLTAGVLEMISSSWPPIALIGPFHVDRIKYVAPIAETSKLPLVSPLIARSEMSSFLPRANDFVLSMQAGKNSYGNELFDLLRYHSWSHIALVITKSASERVSQFQLYVKRVLSTQYQRKHGVEIGAIAWIPPHEQYNDTASFEEVVRTEMAKIWESGVTVIALSIEQTQATYAAVMRAAKSLELINRETAWISLQVGSYFDFCWNIFYNSEEVWQSALGMIATRADLEVGANHAPSRVVMLRPDSYKWITLNQIYQLTYDAVWAVAFGIHACISKGIALTSSSVQNGGLHLERWESGEQLVHRIALSHFKGLSGSVFFTWNGARYTWYQILNVKTVGNGFDCADRVGFWGSVGLYIYGLVTWHGDSIRSPVGNVDICRHHLNVLVPGGRYERYMEYPDDVRNRTHFGWAIDLFKHAADSQCFTNWQFHDAPNMTWDEAIELVGRGHDRHRLSNRGKGDDNSLEFDFAVGPFPVTVQRSANAEFTRTIKTVEYRVAILRPEAKASRLWEFLQPFSWQLWLVTAAFFVFSGLILFALEKKRKAYPENSPGLVDAIFVSMSALFYTQDQDAVVSKSGRGFIAAVCFTVLIFCACFTANLSVFLLKRQEKATYKSMVNIQDVTIGAPNVTGALAYLQGTYSKLTFKDVAPGEGLKQLTSGQIAAYVDDSSILEFQARTNCKIQLLDDRLHTVNAAFAVKRDSPYKEKLNDGIINAWANNFIEELDQKYFEWADECHNYDQVAEDEPLKLQHLGGLFIIFSVTAAVCLLGDLLLRVLYKTSCIQHKFESKPAGVHATARGIKAMVETTADIGLPVSTDSTWSLTGRGLMASEQRPAHEKEQDSEAFVTVNNVFGGELAKGTGKRGPLPPIEL